MTLSTSAASATVRVMGPRWSSVCSIGNAPVYGTRPWGGLCPTIPLKDAGMRIDPAWSLPVAESTAPDATRAARSLERPPLDRARSKGLRTGPVLQVCEPPEQQRFSHTDLPAIVAP